MAWPWAPPSILLQQVKWCRLHIRLRWNHVAQVERWWSFARYRWSRVIDDALRDGRLYLVSVLLVAGRSRPRSRLKEGAVEDAGEGDRRLGVIGGNDALGMLDARPRLVFLRVRRVSIWWRLYSRDVAK